MNDNGTSARLNPLSAYRSRPRTLLLLPSTLVLAAALCAASMPFIWHRHYLVGGGYTVIHGYEGASWLIAAAVIALAFAARFQRWGFGLYGKWLHALFVIAVAIAMYSDYLDAGDRAAAVNAAPYNGPGFYVAVAGLLVLGIAMVVSWRTHD